MKELIGKIDDFLFDFLGLVVPGFILITLIVTPLMVIDIRAIDPVKSFENSSLLSILYYSAKYVDYFFTKPTNVLFVIVTISSYILGHLVKVLSILKYEFLSAIFDKFLFRMLNDSIYVFKKTKFFIWTVEMINNYKVLKYIFELINELFKPLKGLLIKIFTFNSPNYLLYNESLKNESIQMINEKMNTNFPNKWYSIYKISGVINTHENIKSLSSNFLAKYNFYRSMSVIFLFMFFYYFIFFQSAIRFLNPSIISLKPVILIVFSLLWFVFHYKFKRYWTLCGNETLVSLFYFLKKTKND